ncbi:MAG TPA: hypothetical protein VKB86_14740, partial [Pyrinomonadaceae bacterium]|nr:hypothetical protein [Pyrinomonadaceae bacterium]
VIGKAVLSSILKLLPTANCQLFLRPARVSCIFRAKSNPNIAILSCAVRRKMAAKFTTNWRSNLRW